MFMVFTTYYIIYFYNVLLVIIFAKSLSINHSIF
ncbi:hypothetical protein pb186bvf_016539 [Paramecium bursaria]